MMRPLNRNLKTPVGLGWQPLLASQELPVSPMQSDGESGNESLGITSKAADWEFSGIQESFNRTTSSGQPTSLPSTPNSIVDPESNPQATNPSNATPVPEADSSAELGDSPSLHNSPCVLARKYMPATLLRSKGTSESSYQEYTVFMFLS